jgi:uncharacterized lipoprotein YmbA
MKKASTVTGWIGLTGLAALLLVMGCGGRSASTQFYTLKPVEPPAAVNATARATSLTVGPVFIPSSLNRPQIVWRGGENTLAWSEFHRWAGRLEDEIASFVAQDLAGLLEGVHIVAFTREEVLRPDRRVVIAIQRFDGGLRDSVVLDAVWSIKAEPASETLVARRTLIREPVSGIEYNGYVEAQGRALSGLAREIAAAFAGLP